MAQPLQQDRDSLSTAGIADIDSEPSLIRGGPFYRIQETLRLIRPPHWNIGRRVAIALAIGWLPLVILTLLFNLRAFPTLRAYPLNARMLIAVPVLLAGQLVMETIFRAIIEHLRNTGILPPESLKQMDSTIAGLLRWRDSAIPEVVIIALICVQEILIFRSQAGMAQSWAVFSASATTTHLTPAGWYFAIISQPLYLFLLGISLWKWMLWSFLLFKISKLDLQLLPTHPDQHGGLGFLGLSPIGMVPIALSTCFVIGANWREQILRHGKHLTDFKVEAVMLLLTLALLAMVPLVVFVPRLFKLRRQGILQYGALAQLHSSEFHEKWILHRKNREEDLLAAPEVSTLTDLATSFENIEHMQGLPYDKGALIMLAVSFVIPMLPVVLAEIPFTVVIKGLLEAVK